LTTAIPVGVSREALEMLLRYPWPGNVRELQNVIEAGLVLAAGGVIGVAELPERIIDHALAEPGSIRAGDGKSAEQVMIELALARFGGDKAKAARHIGWSRPKLYRLMSRHGIAPDFGKPVR
jgi:two-component system NtrC family response regulator